MRAGPWAFEIIGLYVWLVAAAIPCLLILHRAGWRVLLAASWALYLWYRVEPHAMTIVRLRDRRFRCSPGSSCLSTALRSDITVRTSAPSSRACRQSHRESPVFVTAGFTIFAFCSPWSPGPSWLHLRVVSPERFADLYERYFSLSDLGIGRLLNLSIALPVAYLMLTRDWAVTRSLEKVFVVLGQRSLGAFVLHVYGLLVLAHLPLPDGIWVNTLAQVTLVCAIATLLLSAEHLRNRSPLVAPAG